MMASEFAGCPHGGCLVSCVACLDAYMVEDLALADIEEASEDAVSPVLAEYREHMFRSEYRPDGSRNYVIRSDLAQQVWQDMTRAVLAAADVELAADRAALTAERDVLAAKVAAVEALAEQPDAPYPAGCDCSHGMGFQFHRFPCKYAGEVTKESLRAALGGSA